MAQLAAGQSVTQSVTLIREIGAGGMGRVWLAQHTTLHTTVVVKFLSPEYADSPEAIARFSREASAAAQVKSPHVVQVFDHGVTADGKPYIVMEHLDGRDLRRVLTATTRLSIGDTAPVVVQICKALARAHKRSVVHRDIKPENIYLCDHGDDILIKLLDFGIAKSASHNSTVTGTVIGTAPYMSPEQLVGKPLDGRTDLWSLAVVVYEALTGTLPFPGETLGAVTLSVFNKRPVPPSQAYPPLGTAFDAWFARACAVEVDDRFASASEMAEAFLVAAGGRESLPPSRLSAETTGESAPAIGVIATAMPTATSPRVPEKRAGVAIAVALAIVAVIAAVILMRTRTRNTVEPQAAATPSAAQPAPSPAGEPARETVKEKEPPEPPTPTPSAPTPSTSVSSVKPKSAKSATLPPKKPGGKHDAPIY